MREIIENGIDEVEEYHLAAEALERARKGQEPVNSAANARAALGLDDGPATVDTP